MNETLFLIAVLLPPRALDVLGDLEEEFSVATPYGPAGPFARRTHALVLPYSGLPDRTDPRATIWAARDLGVTRVVGWESVVGLNTVLQRGQLLIPDDFMDWTRHQPSTYFERRGLGYLPQVPAFCPQCRAFFAAALPEAHGAGTYLGFDGPRRETPAEARLFRTWGADVLGLNLVPEIILAKELELCFAALVSVAEPGSDRPRPGRGETSGEFRAGLRQVIEVLPRLAANLRGARTCACAQSQAGPRSRGLLGDDWKTWF